MDTLHLYLDRMREEQLAQRSQLADLREAQAESVALLRAIYRLLRERGTPDSTPSPHRSSILPSLPVLGPAAWLQYGAIGLLGTYLLNGGDALTALDKLLGAAKLFGMP